MSALSATVMPGIFHLPTLAMGLEAPRQAMPMILGRLAPLFVQQEKTLFIADGANCFDPYQFSREARRRGLHEDVLDRVFVTRAFTIHQLAAVADRMLCPLLQSTPAPAIAVLGLDHLFLEESLRTVERARVLQDVMENLRKLRGEGARLLVTYERPPSRQRWWQPMLEFGDIRCRVLPENDDWKLEIERCSHGTNSADIQHLASGGDRVVERLSAGASG